MQPLRENCLNTEFLWSVFFTGKYEPEKTPYVDIFQGVKVFTYLIRSIYTTKQINRVILQSLVKTKNRQC